MLPANNSVFINCPFDPEYSHLFQAICFTIHACGFVPRCALERIDSGDSRLDKICDLIIQCHLGIHDISRTELSPQSGLPRFNMPFELGLYLGCRRFGGPDHAGKRVLVMDRTRHRHQVFLSDLSGQDPEVHEDDPQKTIGIVRAWLQNVAGEQLAGPAKFATAWRRFLHDLPKLAFERGCSPDELSFEDLNHLILEWFRLEDAANS
ncbi:MAG: hypothetical protein JNL98_29770 [Bryobacterales bacterium]|nr:hypothetical protein [Bryobacterales bacterium]